MIQATLTSKGQITIPKSIRAHLNLHTGDRLTFILNRNGQVILTTQTIDVSELFGMFDYKSKKKPLTQKDIDSAIATRMKRKFK
ncbi:MAG: hypothetical protein A3E82_06670 [Gammaproteobacteria bacterium RIFCSPHIGHO2_12_FULL_38_11]|nr:MAG: hypothetical protein A3E82_06670 [Gammaproteobacteria bacterium RIFCSPHIGHO2_12_FULL_38_11]